MTRSPQALENAAKTIASHRPTHRSVLVIESDPDLQWELARMLTVRGNRVVGTSSGDAALTLMSEWKADLVLVAEDLPRMDGIEVARHLRRRHPELIVILMAAPRPEPRAPAPSKDIAAYVTKPFRFEALHALIDSLHLTPAPAE